MSLDVVNLMRNANPLGVSAFQIITISLILGFTSPRSIIRPALLPLIAACTYSIALNAQHCMRSQWASSFGGYASAFLLIYIEVALLSRWSYEARGPNSPILHEIGAHGSAKKEKSSSRKNSRKNSSSLKANPREGTVWNRFCFGFNGMISFRDIDTPFEVKNVPHFSKADPKYVPSRPKFMIWAILRFLACYLVLDIIESQPPPPNVAQIFSLDSIPVFRRINEISIEEALTRTISSLIFWTMVYALLNAQHAFFAIVTVGLGLTVVKAWRPLMGSLSETYTIRGFWGKFWHQSTRKQNTGLADFMTYDLLHLPRGSFIARYSNIFFVFFLSGVVHYVADFSGTESLDPYGASLFFVTQVFGIILEDAVQAAYRPVCGHSTSPDQSPLWTRIVGYIWVAAFLLFWTTPAWFYPNAHVQNPEGLQELKLLPFSVVRLLKPRI